MKGAARRVFPRVRRVSMDVRVSYCRERVKGGTSLIYNQVCMRLTTGTTLGPYEIVGALGAGGMGEVYRARDSRLRRDVAIKVIHSGEADRATWERFEREARAASALSHPNICAVFDTGEVDGQPYLVMELLEGQTLKDRIDGKPM